MKYVLCVVLAFTATLSAQTAVKPKNEYGKEITLAMLPSDKDSDAVKVQKCDVLIDSLINPVHGAEDFSGLSQEVLTALRENMRCAAIALNAKDIDKLGSAMSLNTDASNEILRRVVLYANQKQKQYDELLAKYKVLMAFQLSGGGSSSVTRVAGPCSPAIETQINGDFNGWNDQVIYKMANGEIWQQLNYHYHYHYAYQPQVTIYGTSSGCHIKVDDDDDEGVDVVRIK